MIYIKEENFPMNSFIQYLSEDIKKLLNILRSKRLLLLNSLKWNQYFETYSVIYIYTEPNGNANGNSTHVNRHINYDLSISICYFQIS